MTKTVLALFAVLLSMTANAFVVLPVSHHQVRPSTVGVKMSDEHMRDDLMGATERLLLEKKERKDLGLVQKVGCTVKKDGLDGVRAFVWGIFDVSNYVFPALGAALSFGLLLNMAGYGYYLDDGGVVIDTLQNIQQDQMFQQEAAKMAVDAIEKVSMF